ncbi:lysine-specific demethylase JMJ29-like isoform X2 [Solanum dulcamara]|uniref:lysine-specific demethylase JMJ29-like isoform X2 n=1 Tax=Solanum dulcamara TaxID=45834 RepID=UPI0024868A5F|nr:lysine-specific demethylase JMJ29-like isoform X2 [Solanum dulcamara]
MQNKRMKSDIPIVIVDSSTSEEEDDVDYFDDNSTSEEEDDVDYFDDNSTSEEEEEDSYGNMNKKRKKFMVYSKSRKKESKMCHQCQRCDKDRVVCCSKCKVKRYCLPCINRWYPGMPEEAFLKACPVCRNVCNCIACLRLYGPAKHLMDVEVNFSDEEKLEYSKHIVHALLPALEQFNTEQMIEKQIEYQIQALPDSEVKIHKAKYEKDECIYCNYCSAFIVDFHRSCSSCSYELCLTCCKELRNGNLQADASEVRMQYIDNGPGYLHGKGCSITSTKNETCAGTNKVKIKDQTKVVMTTKWKPKENGTIHCPPKDMGGCGKGTLNLRCIFSENWISQLLLKAKEIAQKCKLKETHNDSELHYSCSKSKDENGTSGGKLRKAAGRENSDDNYVFCPAAVDTRRANLRHFRLYLAKGEPVVVTNVHDNALGLSWEPMVMWRACRQTKKATDVLNCLNWCKLEMNIHQFFKGYMEGRFDSYGWPQLLKLNDWPPSGLFDEQLPRHGAEVSSCLPFMEYTHPQYGYLNLALRLPDNCTKPDLGPKAYIAYGFSKELGRGDSVTKLHYVVTDTVNMLMHTQAVVPTVEQLSAIENLKQIHKAQDQREFVADAKRMHDSIKANLPNENGKSVLKGMNFSQEKQNCVNKKYRQQSVKDDCETNKDGEEYQHREDSSSLFGQDKTEGFEEADGGALWDVFRRQDVPKLEEYLRKHFRECRHIYGSPLPLVVHPILDETFYLSTEHKRRLKEEYGIEPWTFVQKLGEAVFIPAGCPHQVRNLKSCINVAVDFISPENVNECIRLTEELRKLPRNHDAREDKLGVKKIIVHAMSQAVNQLEKTLLNSEAGIATGLSLSSSISKSINSMPGPGMPKSSSSISEDLSSSRTAKREEYVTSSENEKPRTAEVNLRSPLPVLNHLSSANKAMPGPSMPKSSSVSEDLSSSKTARREEYVAPSENEIPRAAEPVLDHLSSANKAMPGPSIPKSYSVSEDLSSSKTVKREAYVAPSEDEKPRTAEVNLHSPLPVLSANKAQESTSVPSQELKQPIKIEDVESTFHTIQSFLKSLPEKYSSQQTGLQSNSTSSASTLAKLIFECSIRLPLEALAHDPMNEKEMCGAIVALNENPSSLFSDEQTKQLVKLKYEFPVMVKKWRDLARAESSYQEFLTNFEEDRKKLDIWIRSEERLKAEYDKKEEQAIELEAILQDIKTRQKEIMDERQEGSREAQKLMLLAQEKAGKIKTTTNELVTTKMQMDGLRKNWSNFQSTFP